MEIRNEAGRFNVRDLCGNLGYDKALKDEAYALFGNEFDRLAIIGGTGEVGKRMMLWEVAREFLGKDPLNYPQEIGDCVSFGAKNAIEYLQAYHIAKGERGTWKYIFPPYLYGCGRGLVGGSRSRGDGSLGIWQAKAVMKYGTIASDGEGVPKYSGSVARSWSIGPPENFIPVGQKNLVRSAAKVKTWEEVTAALWNGYPVTIASTVGFDMTPRSDGFHHYSDTWPHQMVLIGYSEDPEPHVCILNSWGDVHGKIVDFTTNQEWPKGTLRVRKKDVLAILKDDDSFAYSDMDFFPARSLTREDYNPW